MKKTLMTAILFMGLSLFAQSEGRGNSGLIFFGGVGVSMLDESPVLTIDGRVQLEVTPWLNAGLYGKAFHTLEKTYTDSLGRSYQAESATSGIFVQPHWNIGRKWELGIVLLTGMQLVNFRYTEAYRATLVWTEEYADKIVMSTGSIGLTLAYSLCPVHSLQLEGGYRFTGNSQTEFADTARIGGAFFGTLIYGFKF